MESALLVRVCARPFESLGPLAGRAAEGAVREWLDSERRVADTSAHLGDALFRLAGPSEGAGERRAERTALLALRRDVHHGRAASGGGEATAVLPDALRAGLERHAAERARLAACAACAEAAVEAALREARARLLAETADPLVAEGLWLASPSLLEKVRRLAARGDTDSREARFALGKVLGYVVRFATKPSPNGVFCGTALAAFGPHAAVAGTAAAHGATEFRIGVGEARKVVACLARDPILEPLVRPRANGTLRRSGDRWTWWKPASPREPRDEEVSSRAPGSPVLDAFIAAADGTLGIEALLEHVRAATGGAAELAALRGFFEKLVAAGILIAEVEIPWSRRQPLLALCALAAEGGIEPPWLDSLLLLEAMLDRASLFEGEERRSLLDDAIRRMESLPHHRALARDSILRVDARCRARVMLPEAVGHELANVVDRCARLYGALYPPASFVAPWARRFLARFPADTDVPALDLYHGVFDDDVPAHLGEFPEPAAADDAARAAFHRVRDGFARIAREAAGGEAALSPGDLEALAGGGEPAPYSCGVLFQIDAPDTAALDAGRWRACLNALYPGGGLAFSRFSRLLGDPPPNPIEDELRRGHAWLERDGARLAEITYMHSGRTANAGLRPPLLPLEIELPGDRATEDRHAIPLNDLVVRWDSARARFRLRSLSLDVEILPVVSSGISPEGFVSFLIEIGRQGTQPLSWFRGFDVEGVREWPRFTLGRVVLFRRRWILAGEELAPLTEHRAGEARRVLAARRTFDRRGIARHAFVHTAADPKPRYVDTESAVHLAALARELATGTRGARLHVTEMLPGPGAMMFREADGAHATEFLMHVRSAWPEPA